MSHDFSSPSANAPPYTAPTPHEFILLSIALQGIAKVLLDHGSVSQANAPEASTPVSNQQTHSRQSILLKQIAHILLDGQHGQHCCNLHEHVEAIYTELSITIELFNRLNEYTYKPALDVHVLRKNLEKSLRKLEELHMQLEPSYVLEKVTNPRQ